MTPTPTYDEKRLLAELVSGDEQAFTTLYDQYAEPIFNMVVKYLRSPELAKDTSQEILIKVWEKREQLAGVQDFRPYLFNLARNHAIDTLRAASRSNIVKGEIARQFRDNAAFYDDQTLQKDYRAFIRRTIDSLPPRAREVFLLCREEGKTYEEVAAALGISRNSVRNSMVLALSKFREAAKDEFGVSLSIILPILTWLQEINNRNN